MTGTILNVATIVLGTVIGTLVGSRVRPSVHDRVLEGLGLVILVLGIENALEWRETNLLYVMGGVLIGGVVGELLDLEHRINRLGDRVQRAVSRGEDSQVSEAFVTASLVFCIGPLAVFGAIQDGLTGDYDALATKALLDGFASIAFAAALGWGVALSAVAVLIVQGSFSLGAGLFDEILRGEVFAALVSAGGVLLVGIGLRLAKIREIKVANLLPALLFAPLLAGIGTALT